MFGDDDVVVANCIYKPIHRIFAQVFAQVSEHARISFVKKKIEVGSAMALW